MPALYRQYRPQVFADIAGQGHVVNTLQAAIEKDKVAHAYLFQGPRGTGKTTTARVFAKRLNCEKPKKTEPCGKCVVCKATSNGKNIDIIEIDAASNRGIDDIRALRESVGLSPAMSTYKIYIIDEVHMLTGEAFAALLKTLEEPVKHAVFILATTELHKVPDTILSRCQVFRFRRASDKEMEKRLKYVLRKEKRKVDKEVLDFVIGRSDGCYRDAESLLGQMLTAHGDNVDLAEVTGLLGLPSPDVVNNFLQALVTGDITEAIGLSDTAYKDGFDPEQFIQESVRTARDGALARAVEAKNVPEFAQADEAPARLPAIIRALVQASQDLAYVPQPMIALQLAVLALGAPASAPAQKKETQPPPSKKVLSPRPSPAVSLATSKEVPKKSASTSKEVAASVAFRVEDVVQHWENVIVHVKKSNPVSSTFLRATEPIRVEGTQVTLRAQFALHKNFFDKAEHKKTVEKALSHVMGEEASIQCELEEMQASVTGQRKGKEEQEKKFAANVEEVFGLS